ncbi:MAG TPA: TonB-dependent receptor [Vicinamibacteria bacterium]|nr:TonB-dependent receptor [Vicinamibacteria bacterium]
MRRRSVLRRAAVSFAVAVIPLLSVATADPTRGSLAGVVRTGGGEPVPSVVLVLRGPQGEHVVVSGPGGRYRAEALPPGRYQVAVGAPGFRLAPSAEAEVGGTEAVLDLVLQPAPVREQVVVAATRDEAAASTVGATVSVLDRERIAAREPASVLALLEEVPGVTVARNGGLGLQGSFFVRGGESNFVRILVDGVPVNEPGGEYNVGPQLPLELERVEVVRGAASSLYGTDALAGVVNLVTRRYPSAPRWRAEAQGGSFGWRRAEAGTAGGSGRFDWNAGAAHLRTDNAEPNSAFRQTAGAAAMGLEAGAATTVHLTLRGEDTDVGTPGATAFGRPDLDARFERQMGIGGLHLRHARGRTSHELRAGYARQDWASLNPLDSGSFVPRSGDLRAPFPFSDFPDPLGFQQDTRRLSAGYQLEAQVRGRHLVTVGAEAERESGAVGSRAEPLLTPARTNFGLYLQDRVVIGRRLFVTAGGRLERNDSFGTRAVPRLAVAWRPADGGRTTLRASAGAGIKEPTFFESFGVSFYARGNPDLRPERSVTFDAGIEQRLLHDRLRLDAALFHHDYRDQINFQVVDPETFQGTFVNLGRTRARGLEVAADLVPRPDVRVHAQYTLLDGEVLESGNAFNPVYAAGRTLLRRPRHQGSLSAEVGGVRLSGGGTLVFVGKRADSDFLGLGLTENAGYTRLDLRARVRVAPRLEVVVVAENVRDERYQEVLGYPAPGRAVRAGLRFRSGGNRP